jgi:hypothetical protein
MKDCKYFDCCSAPLCPKNEEGAGCVWFSDEEVCRLSAVPEWVKRQRRMSRKAAGESYFTIAMLGHDCRITKNIKGIDPDGTDKERADQEAAWFTAHRVITAKDRERNRAIGLKNRAFLDGEGRKKNRKQTGRNGPSIKKGD